VGPTRISASGSVNDLGYAGPLAVPNHEMPHFCGSEQIIRIMYNVASDPGHFTMGATLLHVFVLTMLLFCAAADGNISRALPSWLLCANHMFT
jgi:hypothetical protein